MSIPSDFRPSAVPVTDFSYVAEGGANLVVAYAPRPGSPVLSILANTVLRIRKTAHGKSHDNPTVSTEEDASVAFTDQVVVPLLPPRSTPRLVSIQLDDNGEWLQKLSQHIEPARPASRRAVDAIDTKRAHVVLADNLVGTANDKSIILSVEIKPKWGFLPNPKHLSEASRPIKAAHCRFCLHKLHKAQLSEQKKSHQQQPPADSHDRSAPSTSHVHASHAKATEDYCPLDLYSGDQKRVASAVQALLKSWSVSNGKGNNLKIFKKGEMIIPDQHPNFVENLDIGGQSLSVTLTAFLATSPLVKRLAHLQGSLDALDIEGLASCAKDATGIDLFEHSDENALVEALGGMVSLDEYTALVAKFADVIDPVLDESTDLRTLIIAYLLSAAFKDCSMFVRISKSDTSDVNNGNPLQIEAFLVDVDVKSLARLGRYARLDKELVECFQAHMDAGNAMDRCRP